MLQSAGLIALVVIVILLLMGGAYFWLNASQGGTMAEESPVNEVPQPPRAVTQDDDEAAEAPVEKAPQAVEVYESGAAEEAYADDDDDLDIFAEVEYIPEDESRNRVDESVEADGTRQITLSGEDEVRPRIANFEMLNNTTWQNQDPSERALEVGESYTLSLFIDEIAAESSFMTTRLGQVEEALRPFSVDFLTFTVRLVSEDFEIDDPIQELDIPKKGKSRTLEYEISPLHDGEGEINVVFLKDNAFIQVINLRMQVGKLGVNIKSTARGIDLASAPKVKGREVSLIIIKATSGFQIIMTGAVAAYGVVKLTRAQIGQMIATLRKTFLDEVVMLKHNNVFLYQRTDPKIPKGINDRVLKVMAEAGANFYNQLFGIMQDQSVRSIGKGLKSLAQQERLRIQIVSDDFTLPWGMLYVGDLDADAKPDPEMFLGMKHIIEHIPFNDQMNILSPEIDVSRDVQIGLNFNRTIDTDTKLDLVAQQERFWGELSTQYGQIKTEVRESVPQMMRSLNDPDLKQDIIYFYCHAESKGLNEGGAGESRLLMTGNKPITLNKMMRAEEPFLGSPLVFLNACESAEMSPEFYGGFVRYFTQKGARGVIGTEVLTPAGFARDFAKEFFLQFLKGEETLGEIVLDLRRNYFYEYNNIMGLVYALYVDGDTILSDPILGTPAEA